MTKLILAGGVTIDSEEYLHWPLFSVGEWSTADPLRLDLFNYVPGGTVSATPTIAQRAATYRDTNMVRASRMNQDESMIVYAITYENFGLTDATENSPAVVAAPAPIFSGDNLRRIQREVIVSLIVGAGIKSPQVGAPWSWYEQSIGAETYFGSGSTFHYGTGGEISADNQRQLGLPVFIGGTGEMAKAGNAMKFAFKLRTPGGAAALTDATQNLMTRWYLDGLYERPS